MLTRMYLSSLLVALCVGCGGSNKEAQEPEGPMEEAGESVDKAAEKADSKTEEAVEDVGHAVEEAGDDIQDAPKD